MAECGLDQLDILNVIRYGEITYECPGLSAETPRRFRLGGKSVDGASMVCVLETNDKMVLVTAYSKRRKRRSGELPRDEGRGG